LHNGRKIKAMKKIIFSMLALVLTIAVSAKENETKAPASVDNAATVVLAGSIADAISGESLAGVEVKIEGTDLKTYTDFDGNFAFNGVKPGEYKVVTSYISYKPATQVLSLNAKETELKIKMENSK
jgi:uncharacterized surface anchored protein